MAMTYSTAVSTIDPVCDDMVLLPEEAAQLLELSVAATLRRAERGEIPGVEIGGRWRFGLRRLTRCAGLTRSAA